MKYVLFCTLEGSANGKKAKAVGATGVGLMLSPSSIKADK